MRLNGSKLNYFLSDISGNASSVSYNNSSSTLISTNVNDAIDEVDNKINDIKDNLILKFEENITTINGQDTYILTGTLNNATFDAGVWDSNNILTTIEVEIYTVNGKVAYNTPSILSLFTRQRLSVQSINTSGQIILNTPTLDDGRTLKVRYCYRPLVSDDIDNYYVKDIVSSVEEASTKLASNIAVNSGGFTGNLDPSDDTSQKCFEKLDQFTGGNPFNQDLNDYDSPTFTSIVLGDIEIINS